eukprot:5209823-Pyramimonas_sp.AAC.1
MGHGNEGGEWILTHGHLRAHYLDAASAPTLQHESTRSSDGFCAITIDMKGYSFVLITFYGRSGIGFSGPNVIRHRRSGALLRASQLPWIVAAGFSIRAAAVSKA